jgi:hypothetical protein
MAHSTNLNLPYIEAAQAQKHITHNEAIRALDALVCICVIDRDLNVAPVSPVDGDRFLIAAAPTGAWAGHAGKIAAWQDGAWEFYAPKEGWLVWAADDDIALFFNGASWVSSPSQNAALLGVNTTADTTNRIAVSSPASLFNHAGAGHRQKINKNAVGDTASQLFQTNFSGRAEIGLLGSDNFEFKVSADGSSWTTALRLDAATGNVGVGVNPATRLHVDGPIRCGASTVATIPSASTSGPGTIIYVSNEAGGAVLAFSDGTNWRRVTDRAVIS